MNFQEFIDAFNGKIVVHVERYERSPSGPIQSITYKHGDLMESLVQICNVHSYAISFGKTPEERLKDAVDGEWGEEIREEIGEEPSPIHVLHQIEGLNGDGCDYVFYMETNGVRLQFADEDNYNEHVEEW